jgi:hypothetical protein
MALIPTHVLSSTTSPPTPLAAAANDTARVGAHLYLLVRNTSGSPVDVTIAYPGKLVSGVDIPDTVTTVPATTGERWIPLLEQYGDATLNNQAAVTYSATTNVTRIVVQG